MSRTILSLHAHPDDESSKGAATVARLVDTGARAVLVTATGGEAGDILNPAMDVPAVADRLAQIRAKELEAAARIIGYDTVVMLGYRDSGMPESPDNGYAEAFCNQEFTSVLERVVRIVRAERPDVVFGYDAHELYPHPDHLAIHALTTALPAAAADRSRFPDAGDPWQIPRVYAPIFTRARIDALHAAMLEETGTSPFASWIERFEGYTEPRRRTVRIDVTGYIERGRDALRAHRTQVDPEGSWFAVPTEVVEAVYPWEDFEVLHGDVPQTEDAWGLFAGTEA